MKTYYQMISTLEYEPQSHFFTSNEEIEMLNKHFGLEKMTAYELQNLRDMFMLIHISSPEKFSGNAMMSVTAVIDHYKIRKGGEI